MSVVEGKWWHIILCGITIIAVPHTLCIVGLNLSRDESEHRDTVVLNVQKPKGCMQIMIIILICV